MFQEELYRVLHSKSFFIAILIGLLFFAQGFSDYLGGPPLTQEYLSRLPANYYNAYDAFIWSERGLIGLLGPLLAVLPFSDTPALDRLTGYMRSVLLRTTGINYFFSKYLVALISGGAAISLSMIIFFSFTNIVLPRGINMVEVQERIISTPDALGPFGTLYKTKPDLYILSLIGFGFVFGAVYAIFGLSVSAYIDNRYIALASPFVFYIIVHYILSLLDLPSWSPISALVPHWYIGISWINILLSLLIIFPLSSFFYFVSLGKNKSNF
ncbi:MAG: hypothetical protein PHQ40_11040 [Anaerolineaceae bacterium]|nr:hypothetical protein [Anaerolineaceae bacterium]